MNTHRTWVRPACILFSILVVMLVTIVFVAPAHGRAPDPAANLPIAAPIVPNLPAAAAKIGLTIILLMIASFGLIGLAAKLSEVKERREAERIHLREQDLRDAQARASAGSRRPRRPEGRLLEPRHSH